MRFALEGLWFTIVPLRDTYMRTIILEAPLQALLLKKEKKNRWGKERIARWREESPSAPSLRQSSNFSHGERQEERGIEEKKQQWNGFEDRAVNCKSLGTVTSV